MAQATKKIALVTSTRAEFSILVPLADALLETSGLEVGWIAGGTHFSQEFGKTITEVKSASRAPVFEEADFLLADDSDMGIVRSHARAVESFGKAIADCRPDLLVVLGDRWEIHACATAATLLRVPIAHIHGGEETEGAIDNVLRHSITKLAQIHFAATRLSGRRIRQMGEAPNNVIVSGSPSLDKLASVNYLSHAEFAKKFGCPAEPFLLITYHPQTLDLEATKLGLVSLLACLENRALPVLFTLTNADHGGRLINARIREFCHAHAFATLSESMGGFGYANAMKHALAMVGNSSSGLIEASFFSLPVVNIGDRQKGRERPDNVLDCTEDLKSLESALDKALSPEFQSFCKTVENVYGDGHASSRITEAISLRLKAKIPIQKAFVLQDNGG